jgi:hypothetical protein
MPGRLDTAIAELKCGLAAIDDARCLLHELGWETPADVRSQLVFQQQHHNANKLIQRGDAMLGALTRQQDKEPT